MNLEDYVDVLRARWRTVTAVVIIFVGAATAYAMVRPPEYTTGTALYVSAQAGDVQQAFQGTQLSEQRVKSYIELATSDRVLGETLEQLGLPTTVPGLASRITATAPLDSVIINIEVSGGDPRQVAMLADTVASNTIRLVDELEAPPAGGTAPVVVRVVQPAAVPAVPTSPGLISLVGIGVLAGLMAGVGIALLRDRLDRTVTSLGALEEIVGAPSVGLVFADKAFEATPLLAHHEPGHPAAEAFRHIRTNLQFVDVDSPPRTVLITSAVAGEGKTTVAANLALVVSSTGPRVLLVEADLRRPRLSAVFGLDRSVGLTSVLAGRVPLMNAVQDWHGDAVSVLASGPTPPNPSELLASNQMRIVLEQAKSRFDLIIVDAPPLLPVTDAAALAGTLDGTILICRHGSTTEDQVAGARSALATVTARVLGSVFTAVPKGHARTGGDYRYGTDQSRRSGSVASRPAPVAQPARPRDVDATVRVPPGELPPQRRTWPER